ncbi:MFS transporter [Burkholderia sp. JPY481]
MIAAHNAPRHRLPCSFYLLLAGQTVSLLGSQVTFLALPLTAIELHNASPFETGILLACGRAPYLLLGLLAGVLTDRFSHRMLLMTANTTIALTLASVPLAASLVGHVSTRHLYMVATVAGTATVIADVAFLACVPTVVRLPQLVQAQSRLELGQSAALIIGLPLAGWLISTFSAAIAILADVASFVLVTMLLPWVSMRPVRSTLLGADRRGVAVDGSIISRILSEATKGALLVLRTSRLRAITFATGTLIFFYSAYSAVFLPYLTKDLRLTATAIGTVMGIAALGSAVGALLARLAARALGLGRVLVAALCTSAVGAALAPMCPAPGWLAIGLSQFLLWTGQQMYNVHQVPIRFMLAPPELHGRANATIRTIVWGLASFGALLGGSCGTLLGSRATLLFSGALIAMSSGWILTSPLRTVRTPQLQEGHAEPTFVAEAPPRR